MNILGIDFEEWYHPELIQRQLKTTNNKPSIINGSNEILDWLRKNEVHATFFVVGELLEIKPELLDDIISNGHEIAFHTMYHTRLDSPQYYEKFIEETKKFSKLTNGRSKGFRAPTFSLNESSAWVIDILEKNGYQYDSSIVPAKSTMYGFSDAEQRPYKISSSSLKQNSPNGMIWEFPILVTKLLGKKIPVGGGFYLRTLPLKIIKNAIVAYEKKSIPATFYVHSWELTPKFMPKIPLPKKDKFVTYHNIEKTLSRLNEIIKRFSFTSFERYLKQKNL